jgi:ubiquinone/menaquinone biosynthesis C-methylase UbiE
MSENRADNEDMINKEQSFSSSIARPASEEQRMQWQAKNRHWWSQTPMRYDWREAIPYPRYSAEYFKEIDDRFFSSVKAYMPWKKFPFEQEIPYVRLPTLDVLEIGVGQGSHASLIAPHSRSFTGIDLTEPAVAATRIRMEQLELRNTKILQMDAEEMSFDDSSFDYIWSWGVVHHSADTRRILEQMHRVLRPGGCATVMVYHRSIWKYYIHDGFFKGLLGGRFFKGASLHDVNQAATDGAIARIFRKKDWGTLSYDLFRVDSYEVSGLKSELFPLPGGKLKSLLQRMVPDSVSRFFTNTLGWGSFLTICMTKR